MTHVFSALRISLISVSLSLFSSIPWSLGGPTPTEKEPSADTKRNTTAIALSSTSWALTGNLGTNPISNWIGTIDSQDMAFKTQSTERMRIHSSGPVSIFNGLGVYGSGLTVMPYKRLTVNGDVSLANYNGSGGNATNGLNGIEVLGHGGVPGRRGISTGDDPSGDLTFFINANQTAAAFHFKNGTAPNFQNYVTAASAPTLMTLDATGSMTIPSLAFGSTFTSGPYRALLVDASNGKLVSGSNVTTGTSSVPWTLGGNTGTTGQPIGTRDPGTDFPIIAGGVEVMRVQSNGTTRDLRINDNVIYLRGGNDPYHGVGYFDGATGFVGAPVDGPVLFGYSGGALGTNRAGTKNVALAWNSDGKIIIGNETPTGNGSPYSDALLSVAGKVVSKSFYVTINYWTDFVFEKDYKLMALDDVEAYYSENRHLPGVPSANAMMENGDNIAQTDAVLLQKIEELTLYTVALNKKVKALEGQLAKHHHH